MCSRICARAYACAYVYIYIYICVCVCVCVRVYTRKFIYVCPYLFAFVCARICAYIYACVCVCIYIYKFVCVCVYIYIYIYAYAYVFIYLYIYIYIYTHTHTGYLQLCCSNRYILAMFSLLFVVNQCKCHFQTDITLSFSYLRSIKFVFGLFISENECSRRHVSCVLSISSWANSNSNSYLLLLIIRPTTLQFNVEDEFDFWQLDIVTSYPFHRWSLTRKNSEIHLVVFIVLCRYYHLIGTSKI